MTERLAIYWSECTVIRVFMLYLCRKPSMYYGIYVAESSDVISSLHISNN